MKGKKLFSFALAMLMAAAALAGCAQGGKPASGVTGTSAGTSTAAPAGDYTAGFPERVTLEIPVYDRAFEGWNVSDNYYTKWVQKEFGDKYNIDVKYVAIARNSEVTDYQQMLAAHKAPDVIFHYDMPQALAYYGEGVMQTLDLAEVEKYAPTYWAKMKDTIQQYGSVDGKSTFVFAARPMAYNALTLIRKDWVEQVGMKMEDLTSLEAYNEMLVKWKEAGLGKHGERLLKNNFTYNYTFRDWPEEEKSRALYSDLSVADFTSVATERYLRNMNYMYNNDLVDKEFYLRDDDNKAKAEFVAGRTGVFYLYLANNSDIISATLANNPDAEFATLDRLAWTPKDLKPQERGYWPFGMIMGINYESTEQERIAAWMYLEWMSQPENLFYFQYGIEGENYTLDSDGIAVRDPDFAGDSVLSQNNNKDYWCLVTESVQYADPAIDKKANIRNWAPEGYEALIEDSMRIYDTNEPYRLPDKLFNVVLENVNEYKADLNDLFQQLYVKVVMAPEDQFDEVYAAAKEEYLDAGYQSILDEKKTAIESGAYA